MVLLLCSPTSLLSKNPKTQTLSFFAKPHSLSFSLLPKLPILSSLRFHSIFSKPLSASPTDDNLTGDSSPQITDEWGEKSAPEIEPPPSKLPDADPPEDEDEWGGGVAVGAAAGVAVEWGERSKAGIEPPSSSKLPDADPPEDEDELGGVGVNGSAAAAAATAEDTVEEDEKVAGLKRRLVDMVNGTDFGFRASTVTWAEALEVVTQLEALNPTPAPTEAAEILDGKWVLV